MLSVQYLLDRCRHPRSRADELCRLRARLAAQPSRWQVDGRAVERARALRRLRQEMHRLLGEVPLCARCARGHPLPAGRWAGGHCCGGRTLEIFAPIEVAALKLSGVTGRDFRPPRCDHAGCAFRGPAGCSLPAAVRPTICLRHVCFELRAELKQQGRWAKVARLEVRLGRAFADFAAAIEPSRDEAAHSRWSPSSRWWASRSLNSRSRCSSS